MAIAFSHPTRGAHMRRFCVPLIGLGASLTAASHVAAQSRAPVFNPAALTAQQQLSREIYKELVEINTGVETGNITTAALAMAARFKAAGIPEADIFVGGPRPEKHNVVARIRGKGGRRRAQAAAPVGTHRCRGSAQGRLVARPRSLRLHGARRLLLRTRNGRRQGDGLDLRGQRLPHEAGRASCPIATSSSRSPPTKKAVRPTGSTGC